MLNTKLLKPLSKCLDANLARLKCLSFLVGAVMQHRTVNLTVLATSDDGKDCSTESRYRRLQDFFLNGAIDLDDVGRWILSRMPKPKGGFVLAMDRTNWEFGRRTINFLAISIIVGKVSIPVVWKILPKSTGGGNSNAKQRIALTKRLLQLVPAQDIKALTMDREFIGDRWLRWLDEQKLGYVVRIKKNVLVDGVCAIARAKSGGRRRTGRRAIFAMELFFGSKVMVRGGRDSHLMVVSNRFEGKEALELYRQRWGIERLFGHLKKKGFDLEATHITDGAKLEKLFAVVSLAFLLSFGWGCHLRLARIKTCRKSQRKSLFRLGLENILSLLNHPRSQQKGENRRRELMAWLDDPNLSSIFLV